MFPVEPDPLKRVFFNLRNNVSQRIGNFPYQIIVITSMTQNNNKIK